MLYGGRVAEEMTFGPERVTTGAGNDIERATTMARRMVTRFGMSDVVGLIAVGDSEQEVFLGRELVQRREISEHTAQLVDKEVKRILDEAHDKARAIISEHEDLLESIAQALLDRETLDATEIDHLNRGEPLPPLAAPEEGDEPEAEEVSTEGAVQDGTEIADEGAATEVASESSPVAAAGEEQPGGSDSVREPAVQMTREDPETDAAG